MRSPLEIAPVFTSKRQFASVAKAIYFSAVIVMSSIGIITLALQGCQNPKFIKIKQTGSLSLGAILVMLFMISLQPYAAVFAFSLLVVKSLILIKLS